jgi:type I restriction enzyme S subunit
MGPFGGMLIDLDSADTGFKVYGQENTISGDFTLGRRWISQERFASLTNYHLRSGDLVLTRKGSLGSARLVRKLPQAGIIDSDTIRIRVNRALIREAYIALILHGAPYLLEQITLMKRGAILAGVNTETIASLFLILPPLDEQLSIENFLCGEFTKIDVLIAEQQRLIELLKEKRQAVISHAVTRGLNADAPMKPSGVEWLGDVPAHWSTPPLYLRYEILLGKMLDEKRITGEHLVPYVRNADVQWDLVRTTNLPAMDIGPHERERYTLKVGDLLVCEGGEVGRTAVWNGPLRECGFQKALHRLRPLSANEHPRYFYYCMRFAAATGIFLADGNPNTIPHLTGEKLRIYRFPKPRSDEQRAIAEFLDAESSRFDNLIWEAERAIALLQERRTALISAAVTGKIDVRGFEEKAA